MQFKGTKGRWEVVNGWNKKGEGKYFPSVVLFDHQNSSPDNANNRIIINISHNQEKESIMANAKLIAAAPDMLMVLQKILDYDLEEAYPGFNKDTGIEKAIEKALK